MNESPSDETDYGNKSSSTGASYNETTSRKTQSKPTSSTQPDISMKNFLDFLATAYRLNDALENYPLETFKKSNAIDWNQLSACTFVSILHQHTHYSDKQSQKRSSERDHEKAEEVEENGSVKKNGSHESLQQLEQGSTERVDDECKPLVKQNSKRGEKHKRARSGRGDKGKLDKRRNSFVKKESLDSKAKSRNEVNIAEKQIKRKLSEVLQEGILDSVLPYVVPKQNSSNISPKKPLSIMEKKNGHDKSSSSLSSQSNKDNIAVYHSRKQSFVFADSNGKESAKE